MSSQDGRLDSGNKEGKFYSEAHFLSAAEVLTYLAELGFERPESCQTLFKQPEEIKEIEIPEKGHGKRVVYCNLSKKTNS